MADLNGNMAGLVLEEGDGLQELHDWLFGRVADDNDVVVDKVRNVSDVKRIQKQKLILNFQIVNFQLNYKKNLLSKQFKRSKQAEEFLYWLRSLNSIF